MPALTRSFTLYNELSALTGDMCPIRALPPPSKLRHIRSLTWSYPDSLATVPEAGAVTIRFPDIFWSPQQPFCPAVFSTVRSSEYFGAMMPLWLGLPLYPWQTYQVFPTGNGSINVLGIATAGRAVCSSAVDKDPRTITNSQRVRLLAARSVI